MHPRLPARVPTFVVLILSAFASIGASCKKTPDAAVGGDEVIVELPGVDTSSLVVSEKRVFSKVVREYMSPCGEPVTLEVCVKENRPCAKCMPAAQAIGRAVRDAEDPAKIREWLDARFDPKAVKTIDVTGNPSMGPVDAPITMVEFADFECPHCAAVAPVVHALLEEPAIKPKVRFYFKNFPLSMHEHAEEAAKAASAAQVFGKFWEMHDQLFTHQSALTPSDLDSYARKIGIDADRFRVEMNGNNVKDRVAKDKEGGKAAGISGTPAIFVNGRFVKGIGRAEIGPQLREWIQLELALGSKGPAGAPSSTTVATAPATEPSTAPTTSASSSAAVSAVVSASVATPSSSASVTTSASPSVPASGRTVASASAKP